MLALLALGTIAACGRGEREGAAAPEGAMALYDNLGSLHHESTTDTPEAQRYFDQGMRLLYAFNHAESSRSFEEAERLDPACAMCAWGVALANSPNINQPMDSARGIMAYAAIQRAVERAASATPHEQAHINAMAQRFAPVPVENRAALDSAYANAMREVADTYPDDQDAQVLYADALMNLSPWNYWTTGGDPRPGTDQIVSRLESVMSANPDHPGACHLFIHAEEAHDPTRAVECAERLAALMPGAGHIVHMPGHIYIRVGRYQDAVEANKHAVHADESYLEGPLVTKRGIYPQGYYPHNYHFMSFAASMAGNSETAIYAARQVAEKVGPDVARDIEWLEAITPVVHWTLVTFGRWDEILAEPLPPPDLRFTTGQAYYARGIAHAAKGQWDEAQEALDSLTTIAENFAEGDNKTALAIARHAVIGEMALRRDQADAAVQHLQAAVELESGLTYNEPPTWYYPMRQSLGKALIAAGLAPEAQRVYQEDLKRFPENGWSLFGLATCLDMQGKSDEAVAVRARLAEAWKHADVELVASRF
jgi:tetratricopeptide (TPR) repeat protein